MRPTFMIGLSLIFALLSAALTWPAQVSSLPNLSGATLMLQTTPTPKAEGKSEVGSTDQIMIMGGVIVLIIFTPILISRKAWQRSQPSTQ